MCNYLVVGGECSWCNWLGHCTLPLCRQIYLYQNMCNVANILVIIITDQHNYTDS
jgi:hypothetical protein